MGSFQTDQWIAVELPKVFHFFSDPNNLPRIMPAELQASVLFIDLVEPSGGHPEGLAAGIGTKITFSYRPVPFLPIRQRWTAQILDFDYGSNSAFFIDRQLKGPFKSWVHHHGFEVQARDGQPGTRIIDRVEFEVGYGVVGQAIDGLITERVRQTFVHRQEALAHAFK